MRIIVKKYSGSSVPHEHPVDAVVGILEPRRGAGADERRGAARAHARGAGSELHRDCSQEHALTRVTEPEKAEPAVAPLFDRLALAEVS